MAMEGYSDEKQKGFINVCRSMEDFVDKSLEMVINNKELKEVASKRDKLVWDMNEIEVKETKKSAAEMEKLKKLRRNLNGIDHDLRKLEEKREDLKIALVSREEAIEKAAEVYRDLVGDGPAPVIKIRHRLHVRAAAYLEKVPRVQGDWVFSDEVWRSEPHAQSMLESADQLDVDWRPIPRRVVTPAEPDLPAIDATPALPLPVLTAPASSDPDHTLPLLPPRLYAEPDLEWETYFPEEVFPREI